MAKLLNFCRFLYVAYFSRPKSDRAVYRAIYRGQAKSVLELGLGRGLRAGRMIQTMRLRHSAGEVRYTGIDLFELSPTDATSKISLKAAHCTLKPLGARVRLVPGDPFTALATAANEIGPTDIIVIAAGYDADSLNRAWFYLPRLLHPTTRVFIERPVGSTPLIEAVSHEEVRRRAHASLPRRTAA